MKLLFSLAVLIACWQPVLEAAGAPFPPQRIVCPAELPDSAFRIGETTNGWIPYKFMPLRLESAAPTAGAPEEQADLAGFSTAKTRHSRIDTYPLPPPHPGGIWMKCGYGSRNEITLHRKLDDRIRECRISTSNKKPVVIDIVCQ